MSDKEWWRGAVIYQIYPRSFMDSNGDGVGDLVGIAHKMDYVASLGVDAIWISPFFKSPMKDFGYDISDYRDVDPIFGTLDDFHFLLKEAHKRGLKVLLDQVWSHTSDQHIWFKESRQSKTNAKEDWYIWSDPKPDGTAPNNWLSIFGGPAWTWDSRREQYYLHHFLKEQPALNLWNPKVREQILETARYWLEMGVDGFRLDVINCALSHPELADNPVRPEGMAMPEDMSSSNPMARQIRSNGYGYLSEDTFQWLGELRSLADEYGGTFLMGEIGGDNSTKLATEYVKTDKRLHSAYSFGLTGKKLIKKLVTDTVTGIESLIEDGWMTYALGNHDNQRFASSHGNFSDPMNKDYALFGMALLLSLRGTVCVYQGEELGLPSAELSFADMRDPYDIAMYPNSMNRDSGRTPIPWLKYGQNAGFSTAEVTWIPVYEEHIPLAVDRQETDEDSILNHYKQFLRWRSDTPIMKLGDIELLQAPDHIIAFTRHYEGDTMLCVFHSEQSDETWPLPDGEYELVDEASRNAAIEDGKLTLQSYGYAILKKLS